MSFHKSFQIGLVFIMAWLFSCASYTYWDGKALMNQKEYVSAIKKFLQAERESPTDYRIKREFGIALFELKNYDRAILKLKEAKKLKPDDGLTILYMGMSYESLKLLDEALAEYSQVSKLNRFSSARGRIQERIKQVMQQKISTEIRQAIENEQNLKVADIPENTIAILYFKNISQWEKLSPLEKGLAVMLTTDLSKVRSLKVIERMKLQQLMAELELSKSKLFDVQTAPRLGRLLGAHKLVKGGFLTSEEGYIQIIAAVVESSSGSLAAEEAQADGRLNEFFEIEKKLVFQLIKEMGIKLSYAEIEEIKKVPTNNLLAFLAYAEGLDFDDNGDLVRAQSAYRRAVKLDPNFKMANEKANTMEIGTITNESLVQFAHEIEAKTPVHRLQVSAQKIGSSFLPPEQDERAVVRPSATGIIIVKGRLPNRDPSHLNKP